MKMLIAKYILLPFLKLFFDKKYLKGRWFDNNIQGYRFAFRALIARNILRLSHPLRCPVSLHCNISNMENITFDPEDINNFNSSGTYFQNFNGHITLGKGTYIAPNVGIITSNHDLKDLSVHLPGENVVLGESCWVGMNSVILPGVTLGANTVVAAGSVVTKSFPDGGVIIGGSPAKVIKQLPH
ncbi:acyltransferase [Pseudoalteromonas sp. MMG012]|uniref:acyltransferase n=1 Tax=Pseudoalteromonas sp. MMG012 TaxID=2822686 RepID=UPI001FFD25E4|nr:acyltransferase [Pseudoalteromonas sp. MMG012]